MSAADRPVEVAMACCPFCGRRIGTEAEFLDVTVNPEADPRLLAHADCVAIDAESRQKGGIE